MASGIKAAPKTPSLPSSSLNAEKPARLNFVRPKNPLNGFNNKNGRNTRDVDGDSKKEVTQKGGTASPSLDSSSSIIPAALPVHPLPPPIGLINRATSCFFNASLQCLFACPMFVQFLQNLPSLVPSKPNTTDVLDTLAKHVGIISKVIPGQNGKRRPLDPHPLLLAVRKSSKGAIQANRQEDAHESMCVLLDMMEKACLTRSGLPVTSRVDNTSESTVIHTLFGGSQVTKTTCPCCNYQSSKIDSFLQLSVELDGTKASTLQQLMKKMSEPEKLDAKNLWECDKCKRKVMAERKTEVSNAPNILIVHLKRFGFSFVGGTMKRTKLKTTVTIGSEELLLNITDGKRVPYELVGVLLHQGATVNSGHYFSFVKCAANSFWYEADDEMVSRVKTAQVLGEREAYMLFFAKKDSIALRPVFRKTGELQIPPSIRAGNSESVPAVSGSKSLPPQPASAKPITQVLLSPETSQVVKEEPAQKRIKELGAEREYQGESNELFQTIRGRVRRLQTYTPRKEQLRRMRAAFCRGLNPLSKKLSLLFSLQQQATKQLEKRLRTVTLGVEVGDPSDTSPSKVSEVIGSGPSDDKDVSSVESSSMNGDSKSNTTVVAANGNGSHHSRTEAADEPFSFDRKVVKKKRFGDYDAWDRVLDQGKTKRVRGRSAW